MFDSCPTSLKDVRIAGARNADSLNPARRAARVDLVSPRPARACHQGWKLLGNVQFTGETLLNFRCRTRTGFGSDSKAEFGSGLFTYRAIP
ncbi:unnamed protein product [Prunus armeniaca]